MRAAERDVPPGTWHLRTQEVESAVAAEGGTVLSSYPEIGVVVAYTEDKDFDDRLRGPEYADRIESLGATRTSRTSISGAVGAASRRGGSTPQPRIEPEPREDEQWGLEAVDSRKANKMQPGSADVLVGILDSGIQSDHEDLAAAIDRGASVDCTNNGIPNTEEATWNPTAFSRGTHVAGIVAAQRNGIGVAGVAPGVKLASIKVIDESGYIFPEYALCGLMWSAAHGVDVISNGYYIDPWIFWCASDPEQGPVQEAIRRATAWVEKRGISNIAGVANENYDLADKVTDSGSPEDSTPITRPIDKNCLMMPAELPHVVTVSAIEEDGERAGFSSFGRGIIDVTAPGSDILSTLWPDSYGVFYGTSFAVAHVAGVAALALSQHPELGPEELRQLLYDTAVYVPCPHGWHGCTSSTADSNGFYGHGLVNALNAVKAP